MAVHGAEPLDVIVGSMDTMRRGDLDEVTRWLDPGCWRIIAVEDYAHREEALAAAGAKAPQWA